MKIKITNNLIVIIALVASLASAHYASAYVPGVWEPQPRVQTNEPGFTKIPMTYDAPPAPQTTPATVANPSVPQPPAPKPTPVKTVAKASPTKTTVASNLTNTYSNLPPVVTTNQAPYTYSSGSEITALSLNGSGSFMPSSIWQWILVIFLILVIIIIARMLSKPTAPHGVHVAHGAH
jgi:hypothetical protein